MKLKLNPTYCITPTYTTEGKGRKKKNILNSVSYKFSFNRGIIVNGVVTKKDIKETLPLLGPMGINFYEVLLNTIMSELNAIVSETIRMANDLDEENLTRDDFKDFYENNIDTFNAFISELKQYAEEMA